MRDKTRSIRNSSFERKAYLALAIFVKGVKSCFMIGQHGVSPTS